MGTLAAAGLSVGLATYGGWNDADPAMSEAIWCLVSHRRPLKVLETGVARGITSRVVLEGLKRTATATSGALTSSTWTGGCTARSEQPYPSHSVVAGPTSRARAGAAYGLFLEAIGEIDLFVHDSLHTGRNVRFELETVWPALRPGGALVVDDIGHSLAFDAFTAAVAPSARLTARHAHGGGDWGVVLKGVPGEEAPTGCGSASHETAAAAGRA